MTFAKIGFYYKCYMHDLGEESTFIGHRRLPVEPTRVDTCAVCLAPIKNTVLTTCLHEFCEGCCLRSYARDNRCPICRQNPLPWDNTPLFLRKVLWSYICRDIVTKQTTSAISIAGLVLAYLSTQPALFWNLCFVAFVLVLLNLWIHAFYFLGSYKTLLCDRTPSLGYQVFRFGHFVVCYGIMFIFYLIYHRLTHPTTKPLRA